MNKQIGIITWHNHGNFGSALQAYALQETMKTWGRVEFINYQKKPRNILTEIRGTMGLLSDKMLGQRFERFRFSRHSFIHKYLHEGECIASYEQLQEQSKKYDVIVCGSDQIWAPNLFNPIYFAPFASSNSRKISYAASIGLNEIPDSLVPKYKELLSDFYAISIREDTGRELLKKTCQIESTVVLDPTLLHSASFYASKERKVRGIEDKYLFCYFLNADHNYRERVELYARTHRLKIVGVSEKASDAEWMHRLTRLGADHFIWLINNAEVIMTDSYHGTIFSLLFHKQFWTFVRFAEDSPICQNSRIRQLKHYFGDIIRLIGPTDVLDDCKVIDYTDFEKRLEILREHSMNFIRKALE